MKKVTLIFLCLTIFLIFLIFLAPLFSDPPRPEPAILPPDDLEQYLLEKEARFEDIIPGTEKKIFWADSTQAQSEYSIVYIHGFSASRQETAPLSELIAADLKANLFYTRLTGHGRSDSAMAEATVSAWMSDVIEAMEIGKRLGHKVIVIGTSNGGTLATWLADYYKNSDLFAAILISPNFGPRNQLSYVLNWPLARIYAPWFMGPTRSWQPSNEGHARYWTESYPVAALFPLMQLTKIVSNINMEAIETPMMMIFDPADEVIDHQLSEAAFNRLRLAPKKLLKIDAVEAPNRHVIAGDILSPGTTRMLANEIVRFVRSLPAPPSP